MASAINKNTSLPKYVLIVFDDDLLDYLNYKEQGMSALLSQWLSWLVREFKSLLNSRLKQLSDRAKKPTEPCVYWTLLPLHIGFPDKINEARRKYNFCLETILKGRSDMRVVKLKNWEFGDKILVQQGKITETGLYHYWQAVDAALKFNVHRHELYLAKTKVMANKESVTKNLNGKSNLGCKESPSEDADVRRRVEKSHTHIHQKHDSFGSPNEVNQFFRRHRETEDRFHWRKPQSTNNRFLLPRLSRR